MYTYYFQEHKIHYIGIVILTFIYVSTSISVLLIFSRTSMSHSLVSQDALDKVVVVGYSLC